MRLPNTLAFADIDHTITPQFTLFPVCDALAGERFIDARENEKVQDTQRAFEAGEIDYKTFVIQSLEFAALAVKDRKISVARHIAGRYITEELTLYAWVAPTFEAIQTRGGALTIVSAEPDFITHPVADLFEADYFSTALHTNSDDTYSGTVAQALSSSRKGALVEAKVRQVRPPRVYVFGDSVGDIGMLDLAEPIQAAYCIKPDDELRAHGQSSGMTIVENPDTAQSLLSA